MTLHYLLEAIDNPTADLLGGKGLRLHEMLLAGTPVPPAFVITTEDCRLYMQDPEGVMARVRMDYIPTIIERFKLQFGYMPLVSVRSGAKISMPGMMDTILNVGLTHANAGEWKDRLGLQCRNDCALRLADMFKDVVGIEPPDTLEAQLDAAIEAVFKSWNNERARTYRDLHGIPHDLGTAVVIQAMVFGNADDQSCTGVLFTRNPNTGEPKMTGEFLVNAQGEDVVAGTVTPRSMTDFEDWSEHLAAQLRDHARILEYRYRDMQDIEFTVQSGVLYILQTRAAKRTSQAAIRIAVDMFYEKLIGLDTLLRRVTLKQYLSAISPQVSANAPASTLVGVPASGGVISGVAVFSSKDAVESKVPCILIAEETTPEDIAGINAAVGILTSTGGATSHAAVVARGMDKVCVVGTTGLVRTAHGYKAEGETPALIHKGDKVTLDGTTGRVWAHIDVPVEDGASRPEVQEFVRLVRTSVKGYRMVSHPDEVDEHGTWFVAGADVEISPKRMTEVLLKMVTGVIDLTPYAKMLRDDDAEVFTALFPVGSPDPVDALRKAMKKVGGKSLAGIVVVGAPKGALPLATMPLLSSLEDLLSAVHPVAVVEGVPSTMVDRVLYLREKAGDPISLIDLAATTQPGATVVKTDIRLLQEVLS